MRSSTSPAREGMIWYHAYCFESPQANNEITMYRLSANIICENFRARSSGVGVGWQSSTKMMADTSYIITSTINSHHTIDTRPCVTTPRQHPTMYQMSAIQLIDT